MEKKIQNLVSKLNVPEDWNVEEKEDRVIITLPDSNSYALVYSKLEKIATVDSEMTKINEHTTSMTYYTDDGVDITMSANFDDDVYKVEIELSSND